MSEEVRLYFTAPSRASARVWPSALPTFPAKSTRSIWSILLLRANSRAPFRAEEMPL